MNRRWIVVALSLVVGPLAAELALRQLLFGDSEWTVRLAERWKLRQPGLYADPLFDDDYWKLQRLFRATPEERFSPPNAYDPLLGWRTSQMLANHDHQAHADVDGRRPLLLYGASQCGEDFEVLFAGSDMNRAFGLVNYSVGGYGPDQAYLLMRESLDYYVGRDPVVVFGLDVGGDFDRAVLSIRGWPKPHATLTPDGRLAFDETPIPSVKEYLEHHPPTIKSYVLRAFTEHALPKSLHASRTTQRDQVKRELFTSVVRAIDAELTRRGIKYFYVLFNGPNACRSEEPSDWQERFLTKLFEREGIAFELVRPVVRRALEQNHERVEDYFVQPPDPRMNHPSVRGLTVMLDCFRSGLGKL